MGEENKGEGNIHNQVRLLCSHSLLFGASLNSVIRKAFLYLIQGFGINPAS